MTRMDYMRIGFLFDDAPVVAEKRDELTNLKFEYEFLRLSDSEMQEEFGNDWNVRYIEACRREGVEPLAV